MKANFGTTVLVLFVLAVGASSKAQTVEKKSLNVYLTSDCTDTVGANAASALRERIRASNGYSLAVGATKGHSGYEVILTCASIPGHTGEAAAVSYVFDAVLPDEARYFVQPGIGIVGVDGVNGWAENLFSQFDNWVASVQKAASQ